MEGTYPPIYFHPAGSCGGVFKKQSVHKCPVFAPPSAGCGGMTRGVPRPSAIALPLEPQGGSAATPHPIPMWEAAETVGWAWDLGWQVPGDREGGVAT